MNRPDRRGHRRPSGALPASFLLCFAVTSLAGLRSPAIAVEAPVAVGPVVVDGVLREWGAAGTVAMEPGGREIGLRGVFRDTDDHQADVYVMWDAEHLYVAAAVRDDSLDAGRVPPDEREYTSSTGRVDRLFYFDHFKIFVRGPGADVGANLWVAPVVEEGRAYAWGGRQRQGPGSEVPARASSAARYPVYTYEVAMPWSWLDIHPEPDMILDGLLLLTDSDRPGASVRAKVASGDGKWIWWQGQVVLRGEPPGWQPPPPRAERLAASRSRQRGELAAASTPTGGDAVEEGAAGQTRIREAIERSRAARQALARSNAQEPGGERGELGAPSAAAPTGSAPALAADESGEAAPETAASSSSGKGALAGQDTAAAAAARRYAAAMRTVLTRSSRGPATVVLPDWIRNLDVDSTLTSGHVDSFVVVLTRTLTRLVRERTNGRIDYFVIDMASAAGTRRGQARAFLVALIDQYLVELSAPESGESRRLAVAAQAAAVSSKAARALVREAARRALAVYRETRVTTTDELIRQGRRRADLSAVDAEALLAALFGPH